MNILSSNYPWLFKNVKFLSYSMPAGATQDITSDLPTGGCYLLHVSNSPYGVRLIFGTDLDNNVVDLNTGEVNNPINYGPIYITTASAYNTGSGATRLNIWIGWN